MCFYLFVLCVYLKGKSLDARIKLRKDFHCFWTHFISPVFNPHVFHSLTLCEAVFDKHVFVFLSYTAPRCLSERSSSCHYVLSDIVSHPV